MKRLFGLGAALAVLLVCGSVFAYGGTDVYKKPRTETPISYKEGLNKYGNAWENAWNMAFARPGAVVPLLKSDVLVGRTDLFHVKIRTVIDAGAKYKQGQMYLVENIAGTPYTVFTPFVIVWAVVVLVMAVAAMRAIRRDTPDAAVMVALSSVLTLIPSLLAFAIHAPTVAQATVASLGCAFVIRTSTEARLALLIGSYMLCMGASLALFLTL